MYLPRFSAKNSSELNISGLVASLCGKHQCKNSGFLPGLTLHLATACRIIQYSSIGWRHAGGLLKRKLPASRERVGREASQKQNVFIYLVKHDIKYLILQGLLKDSTKISLVIEFYVF